jgi:hypothetical protein
MQEFGIDDAAGLVLLQNYARAEAREFEAHGQIEREGQTLMDRFGQPKAHPLLSVERDSRAAKMAALKALNLETGDSEPPKIGRPSTL